MKKNTSFIRDAGIDISKYLNENELAMLLICLGLTIIFNLFIHAQNKKRIYIFTISLVGENLHFDISELQLEAIELERIKKKPKS
jgi:hypothetical protein